MKTLRRIVIFALLIVVGATGYTMAMARLGGREAPPAMAESSALADEIRVDKSDRVMGLIRDGDVIAHYDISLGASPEGHKGAEGDERTPTGRYVIDWRNPESIAYLSLHISYPNAADIAAAKARGVSAGGNIMIHGIANGWGWLGALHRRWDWTNGCIAVTDAEMREIWALVPDGTPIVISE